MRRGPCSGVFAGMSRIGAHRVAWRSSCDDAMSSSAVPVYPSHDAEAPPTIAFIDSLTPCTCTCRCKSGREASNGTGPRKSSAAARSGLAHALLHLLGQQRGHGKRGDALSDGPHAVQDQGQVPAPDIGIGGVHEVGRLGEHEDDERDVGRPDVGPELPGRLGPLHQPFDQGRVALACDRDQVAAVGGKHQHLPQAEVAGHELGHPLHEGHQAGPGIGDLERVVRDGRDRVETVHEQRLDQFLLGPEPAVDGADPDAGVTGDLVEADLEPALVERLGGRLQDALPVPLGVPAQRPHRVGHVKPPGKKVETVSPLHATVYLNGEGTSRLVKLMSDVNPISSAPAGGDRRRWLVLGVIGIAQLMVVLDATVMNIALPSAQRALHFTTVDRQWVVTAYTLAFGSLLLLGGRLADLLGRKVTFLTGLAGFAGVSAIGGASVNFAMLVTARACQGVFAALLVPSALSLLTTTFTEPKDRSKAFGIYGAIAGAGGAIGLLLGGALTEYLSWGWTLYVNLIFAGVAFIGGALLLQRQPSPVKPRLDVPGALLVSSAVFCLVYGFSNAATHTWATPSTYGFLAAGLVLGAGFAAWQGRAAHPLMPPRVVLDRNRGGAYASMLIGTAGLFGIFLFLTYYLQQTLGYSPLVTGFVFLPMSAGLIVAANLATIVLMPRFGPKPLVASGMLAAAGGTAWLTQLGPHTGYTTGVLGPLILAGIGLGMVIAAGINTGTFGVAPQDAGVAAATVTVGQMLGGSVGTSLLNTIFAAAVTSY